MQSKDTVQHLLAHSEWLTELARRLVRDPGAADDAVQETWLAALRDPARAAAPGADARTQRGWLARVLRNAAGQRGRSEASRARREAAVGEPHAQGFERPPDRVAERLEAQRLLVEALAELDGPLRDAVVGRYFDGRSATDLGRASGVSASTVRWRLARALEALRERLDERFEGDRSAWGLALIPLLREPHPAPPAGPLPEALRRLALVGLPVATCGVAVVLVAGTFGTAGRGVAPLAGVERIGTEPPAEPTLAARSEAPPARELAAQPDAPAAAGAPATGAASSPPRAAATLRGRVVVGAGGPPATGGDLRFHVLRSEAPLEGRSPADWLDDGPGGATPWRAVEVGIGGEGRFEAELPAGWLHSVEIEPRRGPLPDVQRLLSAEGVVEQADYLATELAGDDVPRTDGDPLVLVADPGVTASGVVVDVQTGAPLADAIVLAPIIHERYVARTDAAGRFVVGGIDPLRAERRYESWSLEAFRPGTHWRAVAVFPDTPRDEPLSGVVLRLAAGVRLAGRVVDRAGEPIYGAVLHARPLADDVVSDIAVTRSGRDGAFRFEPVRPAAEVELEVVPHGSGDAAYARARLLVDGGEDRDDLVLVLDRAVELTFAASYPDGARPEGRAVRAFVRSRSKAGASWTSDLRVAAGAAYDYLVLAAPPDGAASAGIEARAYGARGLVDLSLDVGARREVQVELLPTDRGAELEPRRGVSTSMINASKFCRVGYELRVVDAATGEPLPAGQRMQLAVFGMHSRGGPTGGCPLAEGGLKHLYLSPGRCYARVSSPGYLPVVRLFDTPAQGVQSLTIELSPAP
ncbi:MAG: sigma-70 family RNA polymerase sigma factor [Planctomycetota bacterium]